MLDEKGFGRDIKIEKCSFRLIRSIKKSNFWKFSFFSNSSELQTNNYRARLKSFRQGYQNWKLQFSSHQVNQKIKLFEVLFFQNLQNFERTFTVLGEKLFSRVIKIKNCSLRLKRSIKKPNFWKFSFFFKLFGTLNEHLLCLARKFSAGIAKLKNAVFVSSDLSKNQTFESSLFFQVLQNFERTITVLGWKIFGRDIKIESCSFRLIRSIKKSNFWKFFFSNTSELWTNNYRAWRKTFQQGYQNWKLQSSSQKINKKPNFWKFSFFSNSSELWTNIYCAWRESFRQWYQNWKMQFSSHKTYQKIKLLKVLFFFKFFRTSNEQLPCSQENFSAGISKMKIAVFVSKDQSKNQTSESSPFFQTLRNFEGTFTVLGEKVFGRDIKIDKCSFRRRRSIKESNFWKFSFFSNSSEIWTNIYRAWRKTFRQGIQNWKLQSSSQKINQKTKLLEVLFFSKFFRNLNEHLPCLAKKFSAGISKLKNAVFVSSDLSKNQTFESSLFFNFFRTSNEQLTCSQENFSAGISKMKIAVFVSQDQSKIKTFESSLFFSNSSELWTHISRAWRKRFRQGYQTWKLYYMSSEYHFEVKNKF